MNNEHTSIKKKLLNKKVEINTIKKENRSGKIIDISKVYDSDLKKFVVKDFKIQEEIKNGLEENEISASIIEEIKY